MYPGWWLPVVLTGVCMVGSTGQIARSIACESSRICLVWSHINVVPSVKSSVTNTIPMAKWGEGDPRWIVEERSDATNVNNWHWWVGSTGEIGMRQSRAPLILTLRYNFTNYTKLPHGATKTMSAPDTVASCVPLPDKVSPWQSPHDNIAPPTSDNVAPTVSPRQCHPLTTSPPDNIASWQHRLLTKSSPDKVVPAQGSGWGLVRTLEVELFSTSMVRMLLPFTVSYF